MSKIGWVWTALAAAALLALLAACVPAGSRQAGTITAPASPAATDAAQQDLAPAGPTLGSQRSGDVLGWLSSTPAQPLRGTAEMDAYLVGTEGQPVTDAKVTFDTDMTNMSHGPYLVTAEPAGDGHYVGQCALLMPGPWRVIAIVERPGHETAKLRFEFTVKMK